MSDLPARISALRLHVDKVRTLPEAKQLHDKAKALQQYMRAQGESLASMNGIGEIKLRLERKIGQLIPKQFPRGSRNGEARKLSKSSDSTLKEAGISPFQSVRFQQVAKIPESKFEAAVAELGASLVSELTTAALIKEAIGAHVGHNSGENEWYTPPYIIEAARNTMGSIDLDPASCDQANKTVQARRFFDAETNGLDKPWKGNVWLNPPYAQPLITDFCKALVANLSTIEEACVLVNNATDTEWFHLLATNCDSICFTRGRIRFIDKHGNPSGAPLQGQAILYFGAGRDHFRKVFSSIGFIVETMFFKE